MSTPPHSDLAGLWEFPIEEHLLKLGSSEDLPAFSIGLCTARYESIAPKLLELLERAAEGETFDEDEGRLFLRGLHIIGGCRDRRAFQPLLRIVRRPASEVHDLLGDATWCTLAQIVAGVFDGDVAALLGAIVDLDITETVRDSLLGAATFLTWDGRIPRQELVEFLTRFHAEQLAPEGDTVWVAWAQAITLLGLRDLWPAILAALDAGVLPLEPWELADFEEELAAAEAAPQDVARFAEGSLGYIDDVVAALERCGTESDFDIDEDDDYMPPTVHGRPWAPDNAPVVNPWRGVGRNDPCPCGSGKKAKRCCLAA
jgi:hypothetical protein